MFRPSFLDRKDTPGCCLFAFCCLGFGPAGCPRLDRAGRLLPPGATIASSIFGADALVSDRCRMNLSRQPVTVRAAVNGVYLIGSIGVTLLAVSWLRNARKSW